MTQQATMQKAKIYINQQAAKQAAAPIRIFDLDMLLQGLAAIRAQMQLLAEESGEKLEDLQVSPLFLLYDICKQLQLTDPECAQVLTGEHYKWLQQLLEE